MLKLNKKLEYALIALKLMWDKQQSGDQTLTTARDVCEGFNLPFDTTAKVMQIMSNAGILHSVKGVKGGHCLGKNLSHITFGELTQVIEGKTSNRSCLQGEKVKRDCEHYSTCNIKSSMQWFARQLQHYLKDVTVADFFQQSFPPKNGR